MEKPLMFGVTIPRKQGDTDFTDEGWKHFCEQIAAKYEFVDVHDDHVTYRVAATDIEGMEDGTETNTHMDAKQ